MKKDLKNSILETAKKMFGEQGYNNISMRNIADELGISVGNLTYHFKKKEQLIEAVILEQHKSYRAPKIPESLEALQTFFNSVITHQKKNAYYFRHYTQLAQISPKVYQIQVKVLKNRTSMMRVAFLILEEKGLLKKDELSGQWNEIIEVLNMIIVYWMPSSEMFDDADIENAPLKYLWRVLYPMLTEKGKRIYHDMIMKQIR